MYSPQGEVCPLVNEDQGQCSRHKIHRDAQSKIMESGVTVVRTDVTK